MDALKALGYDIEASRKGYRLKDDDGLAESDLSGGLSVKVFPELSSTMEEARKTAAEGAESGTAILALRQRAGRGRNGRTWESPPGGLYMSIVLRSVLPVPYGGAFVLETAKTLLELLETEGVRDVEFRWPNDIVAGPKKLGGILLESFGGLDRPEYYILGIGLNATPLPLDLSRAVSLRELAAKVPRRRDIVRTTARRMASWAAAPSTDPQRWRGLLDTRQRPARAILWDGHTARISPEGFSPRGELLSADGGQPLSIGECRKIAYQGEES